MTAVGEILAEEIRREGPIPFRRFTEVALFHLRHGYYRRPKENSGSDRSARPRISSPRDKSKPVFGRLIAARVRRLFEAMGSPADFCSVELGPGRRRDAARVRGMSHVPVEIDSRLPDQVRGVFFSNEFLDALPVEAVLCSSAASSAAGSWHGRRGASSGRWPISLHPKRPPTCGVSFHRPR